MGPCHLWSAPRESPGSAHVRYFHNDLSDVANGEVNTALYTDDSKIFGPVKCVRDCEVVQTTVSNMDEWTRYKNIQFNTSMNAKS